MDDRRHGDAGLPEFGAKPWVIRFHGTDEQDEATRTLMDPFDGSSRDVRLPVTKTTTCLRCFGAWSLMLDEETKDCFLLDLASLATVPLPPLLEPLPSWPRPGCALSSPTPPDCTVAVVVSEGGESLLYCRPGDAAWSKFALEGHSFLRVMHGSRGRIYLTSQEDWELIVVDMDSPSGVHVEERDGGGGDTTTRYVPKAYAQRCPLHADYLSEWVESPSGEVFLLRINMYGMNSLAFRDLDIHRFDPSDLSFELVESIGDRTIFASMDSVMVSPATAAGTEPDVVYFLYPLVGDGLRLYTIRLRERTVSFRLVPANSSRPLYWAIPQSLRLEPSDSLAVSTVETVCALPSKVNRSPAGPRKKRKLSQTLELEDSAEDNPVPWSSLNIDYIETLVPKLSSIDYLNLRAVCRHWSKITRPIQDAKSSHPMLMSICSNSGDKYHLFDTMTGKEYKLNLGEQPFTGDKLLVLFSKCGWVIVTEGRTSATALNPFTKEAISLPPIKLSAFRGISFSSAPTYPDSVVLIFHKYLEQDEVDVLVWRAGDEDWTYLNFELSTKFHVTHSNPIFFEEEFYCLGRLGNLSVFSPSDLEWRVLDKPKCIYDDVGHRGDDYRGHLSEFRGELIAVFVPQHLYVIEMFQLDRSQMAWSKLVRLDDATMFVDNWGATIIPQTDDSLCNRIYLPKFGLGKDGGQAKVSVYYDFGTHIYYPEFYGLMEPMNSIWIAPNFTRYSCS
ncbi:hypothetical protein ACP70R_042299 [Stipagrostis hirtigluma subsp. patula]